MKFHDGSPFTAEDVKFTWEYIATGAGNVVKPLAATEYVEEYEIVDDHTIIFHLVNLMPDFPSYLEAKVYSKAAFESMDKEDAVVIGTGPYYFDKDNTQNGIQYAVARFDDYWRGLDDYPTKQIVFREIVDENTKVAALRAGEIDFLFQLSASGSLSLQGDSNVEILSCSGTNSYYMGFNYKNPVFEDLEVRQAFVRAISKDDLIAVACEGGAGGVASYNFCPPSGLGYAEVDAIQYDPEAAKKGAVVGKGLVIHNRSGVPVNARIGNNVLLQGTTAIGHGLVAGDNVVISSMAFIGGDVTIGRNTYIAPGALIRNGLHIGENVIVGLGSVVTKDIPDNAVVYGNPARIMRYNDKHRVFSK